MEGKRDVTGKPPRHYFYTKGLKAYIEDRYSVFGAQCISDIDGIMDSLSKNNTVSAKMYLFKILDNLQVMYSNSIMNAYNDLFSDVSYVVENGAKKYGHSNYKLGMKFSYCISSFMGHLTRYYCQRQKLDTESGLNHLLHCAANVLILLSYLDDADLVKRFNDIPDMFKESRHVEVIQESKEKTTQEKQEKGVQRSVKTVFDSRSGWPYDDSTAIETESDSFKVDLGGC